jgi:hypothetical protein
MAHFAELDSNNVVIRVITGIDETVGDGEKIYQEQTGTIWKKTSYNTIENKHVKGGVPFRKNFAATGFVYDEELDAFIPPKPYPSWLLDKENCIWNPPIERPETDLPVIWDEDTKSWV